MIGNKDYDTCQDQTNRLWFGNFETNLVKCDHSQEGLGTPFGLEYLDRTFSYFDKVILGQFQQTSTVVSRV